MFYILLGVIWFRYHREYCDLDHLILSDLDITGNCVIQISLITIWFRYHLVLSDSDIIRYSESVINGYYKMDSLRSNVLITTEYLWHQFIWRGGESLSLKLDWCLWILSAEAISLFINFYSRAWNFRRLVKASSSRMFLAANQK